MMLVTVSGIVGSGKSTVVRHIIEVLEHDGVAATYWHFRSLPCFTFRVGRPRRKTSREDREQAPAERWNEYQRRRLTARLTLGYMGRILAFRLFRRWRGSRECQISNRYFYDNFVHYELNTRIERMYAALLRRLVPVPDVAILLVASLSTIAARRPEYSADYLSSVEHAYKNLRLLFPQLVEISTDPGEPTFDRVDVLLRERRTCHSGQPQS